MFKKRLLSLVCIVSMAAAMTACGTSDSGNTATTAGQTAAVAAESTEKAETTEKAEAAEKTEAAGGYIPEGDFNIRVFAAAGGVADTITRITAQSLQEEYGATAIVNNLTGASGAVAAADLNAYEPSINEMAVMFKSLFINGAIDE